MSLSCWRGRSVARDQPKRRRARGGAGDPLQRVRAVAAVLGAVRPVKPVVEVAAHGLEGNVLLDAAGRDVALAAGSRSPVPGGVGSVDRAHIQLVPVADHPDDDRVAQPAVATPGCDLELVMSVDAVQLVGRPGHGATITLIASRSAIAR